MAPDASPVKSTIRFILFTLGLVSLVIALANLKMGTELKTVKREGVDVVFALDVSKSMLAEDTAPNRIEKSKQIISKIIDKLGGDRIGLVIYAGSAYPMLPITTDHGTAKMFLQSANTEMLSSQGTALDEALQSVSDLFNKEDPTSKYMVMLSDGEGHEDLNESLLSRLKKEGIKTITVGVGTTKGGPIPLKTTRGNVYKKDKNGDMVITHLTPSYLKKIAKAASGNYIYATSTKEVVNNISKQIYNAQKKEYETKQFSVYKDQYHWFLAIGLLFIVLETLMTDKKTAWIQKLNLFNEKKQ